MDGIGAQSHILAGTCSYCALAYSAYASTKSLHQLISFSDQNKATRYAKLLSEALGRGLGEVPRSPLLASTASRDVLLLHAFLISIELKDTGPNI